jgi:hypothetical protein
VQEALLSQAGDAILLQDSMGISNGHISSAQLL